MASNNRMLIILNPTAGQGKAGARRAEIETLAQRAGLDFTLRLTTGVGHATALAQAAGSEGFSVVTAAGGDGTVNEVLNGLMAGRNTGNTVCTLGVLAVGRGNDFAYGAGIPSDLAAGVALLAEGSGQPLDVGLIRGGDYPEGKYFGNGVGIGFDTLVGLEAAKMRRVKGFMAYVLGALKTFIRYPPAPLVQIGNADGLRLEQKSHQISIMNGKRMGGTFFMAPEANNDDGLFDLCLADELGRLAMLGLMARYVQGTQAEHPAIRTDRSSRYHIAAPQGGLNVHADGETICVGGSEITVECVPAAVMILRRQEESR